MRCLPVQSAALRNITPWRGTTTLAPEVAAKEGGNCFQYGLVRRRLLPPVVITRSRTVNTVDLSAGLAMSQ